MIDFSFEKPANMSNEDYLKYLYLNKSELGLSWKDIADKLNNLENTSYSEDRYRKMCKKFSDLEPNDSYEDTSEFIDEKIKYYAAAQAYKDERNQLNSIYRQISREEELKRLATECAKFVA